MDNDSSATGEANRERPAPSAGTDPQETHRFPQDIQIPLRDQDRDVCCIDCGRTAYEILRFVPTWPVPKDASDSSQAASPEAK